MKVKINNARGVTYIESYDVEHFISNQVKLVPGIINIANKSIVSKFLNVLNRDYTTGVDVNYLQDNQIGIAIYVVLDQEVNIIEITNLIQEIVKYKVAEKYNFNIQYVDVFVKGIR